MLNWKSKSLGEKVIIELAAIIVISQINRFAVMVYSGTMPGIPVMGAVLATLFALAGLVLVIVFIMHLVEWLKSMGKSQNISKKAEITTNLNVK